MLERKNIRLRRDETVRVQLLKKEYNRLILMSVKSNRMLCPITRFYASYKIAKTRFFVSKLKNICLTTGRARGTTKTFNISRHVLNKQSQQGLVNAFTRNNRR